MKRAVSVSLGSSTRDKKVIVTLGDDPISVERIGTNGDVQKARSLFAKLDGVVDALGVGGVDLYLRLDDREYSLHYDGSNPHCLRREGPASHRR